MTIEQAQETLMEAFRYSYLDTEKAFSLYKSISSVTTHSTQHPFFVADMNYLLYRIYLRQALYEEAKEVAARGLEYAAACGDKKRYVHALMAYANIHLILHDTEGSSFYALESHTLAKKLTDASLIVKVEFLLGRISLAKNEYRKAREHFFKALSYISSYTDDKERGDILLNICACYMNEGNWADSIIYGLEVIKCKERYHVDIETKVTGERAGWLVYASGEYIRVSVRDDAVLADAYYNVGVSYRSLGDNTQAIEYLMHALAIKENIGDAIGIANCSNELGVLYVSKDEKKRALQHFEQSRRIFSEKNIATSFGYVLLNIAWLKKESGEISTALTLIDEAERQFATLDDKHGIVNSNHTRAHFLRETGRIAEAIDKLNLTLRYTAGANAMLLEIRCYYELGLCYHELGKTQREQEALKKALNLAEEHGVKNELIDIHQALSTYYQAQECFEEALLHHREYEKIKNQLFNEENDRQEKNLLILHEVKKYKRTAEESQLQLQRAKAELEAKTQQLADFALRIVEKQEFLAMIERGLERILQSNEDEQSRLTFELLQTVRNQASVVEKDWRDFQIQFKGMQKDFISILARVYPKLSPTELKVCALLRMNLRTKEIANILHVAGKAVENYRVRMRKKMGLPRDANLVKTLLEIGSAPKMT